MRSIWVSARNTCKPVAACIATWCCCAAFAQSTDPFVSFQQYTKGQSDRAYVDVEKGLGTIPKDIRDALMEQGYGVVITPTMLTAMPGWDGAQPRGWSADANYDNVGGLFQPRTLRVIVCETTQDMQHPSKYVVNDHIATTVRHEIGHAWDRYQGGASSNDDFVDAYLKDSDHFNTDQQREFAYYLQPGNAGNQELFAQLFAAAYTPDADSDPRFSRMLAAFPKTAAYILKLNPKRAKWEKKVEEPVAKDAPPVNTKKTTASEPPHVAQPWDDMIGQYRKISELYSQGKLAEVEPLMRAYIATCERSGVSADRLNKTYSSYAALLRKLGKPVEAARVEAKIGHSFLAPKTNGVVGLKFKKEEGDTLPTIENVYNDTPASKAGLRAGDQLLEIDGKTINQNMTATNVQDMVMGPAGATVTIIVLREDKRVTVKIQRVPLSELPPTPRSLYDH